MGLVRLFERKTVRDASGCCFAASSTGRPCSTMSSDMLLVFTSAARSPLVTARKRILPDSGRTILRCSVSRGIYLPDGMGKYGDWMVDFCRVLAQHTAGGTARKRPLALELKHSRMSLIRCFQLTKSATTVGPRIFLVRSIDGCQRFNLPHRPRLLAICTSRTEVSKKS
jgi:hypothetical protein